MKKMKELSEMQIAINIKVEEMEVATDLLRKYESRGFLSDYRFQEARDRAYHTVISRGLELHHISVAPGKRAKGYSKRDIPAERVKACMDYIDHLTQLPEEVYPKSCI